MINQLYNKYVKQTTKQSRILNIISMARFLCFVGMIFFILVGYFKTSYFYFIALILLITFIVFVNLYQRINDKYEKSLSRLHTIETHQARQNYKWDKLRKADIENDDLDIFGEHSLFRLINCTHTLKGERKFCQYLQEGVDPNSIHLRQEALKEICDQEICIDLESECSLIRQKDEDVFFRVFQGDEKRKCWYQGILFFPFLSMLALFLYVFNSQNQIVRLFFEVVFLIQVFIWMYGLRAFKEVLKDMESIGTVVYRYRRILDVIDAYDFKCDFLKKHQQRYRQNQIQNQLESLYKLVSLTKNRRNIFFEFFSNILFNLNYWMVYRYRKMTMMHLEVLSFVEFVGEMECLISLASVYYDGFDVCLPTFHQNMTLKFNALAHPLIEKNSVVTNDFSMKHNMNMISGSNMSGKSTFLRTIGINLSLAYAGGFVFASSFDCSFMRILTSMRIRDYLGEGISTFYQELLNIKKMVEFVDSKIPCICLIDEIFRGTNSQDRLAGVKGTLTHLNQKHVCVFFTTHDLSLRDLDFCFDEYHFEEYYQDNKMFFDYKIKDGHAHSHNGLFLLKEVGILK